MLLRDHGSSGVASNAEVHLRILVLTTEYPPYSGGVATFAEAAAGGLSQLGAKVTVIAPSCENAARIDRSLNGVRVLRSPWRDSRQTQVAVLRRMVANPPDVVLLANGNATTRIAPLGTPPAAVAVYLHGSEVYGHFGPEQTARPQSLRAAIRELFSSSICIMANSRSTASLFEAHKEQHGRIADVVYLGIDPARIPRESATERRETVGGRKVILCVSRLSPDKGHDILLRALPIVQQKVPEAILHFAGDGPCREELQSLCEQLSVDASVRFLGDLSTEDLATQYQSCDVFAMISRRGARESFGLVFLEANLFGKPVVAGRTGGVPESVVDGVTGLLVDSNNASEVAVAIIALLQDPERAKKMGEAGRERVLREFTHLEMARNMLNLFERKVPTNQRRKTAWWAAQRLAGIYGRAAVSHVKNRVARRT
jgi:phosphatidylinositol alpha-1,6-mannosyltransferase